MACRENSIRRKFHFVSRPPQILTRVTPSISFDSIIVRKFLALFDESDGKGNIIQTEMYLWKLNFYPFSCDACLHSIHPHDDLRTFSFRFAFLRRAEKSQIGFNQLPRISLWTCEGSPPDCHFFFTSYGNERFRNVEVLQHIHARDCLGKLKSVHLNIR